MIGSSLPLGWNRGRYGQILEATKAIARRPALLFRYSRVLFTQPLKKQLIEHLGYGLALEGLSVVDRTAAPDA